MSQSGQTKAQRSSQVPATRAPPQGSTGSGYQQQGSQQRGSSGSQDNENIPSNAVTSSTSKPNRSSYPQQDQRRQSNVTFAQAPPVDPSDSISQIKARSSGKPGPNRNSGRRASRSSWNEYASQVTRSSSQHGIAWSGTGPALTENNLEKFNEENENARSSGGDNQEPASDQQEVPQSNKSKSRGNENATNGGGAQTNGTRQTGRRSSRRYSEARNVYSQAQSRRASGTQNQGSSGNSGSGGSGGNGAEAAAAGAAGAAGEAAYSQSRRQSMAVSKNVIDANNTQSGANQSAGGSQSKSKAVSQSRSRRDSKIEGDEGAAQTSNEVATESKSIKRSGIPYRPSQPSASPTSPTSTTPPWGYERKTRIITKRWPDGTEIREKEIRTMQPVGAA